MHTTLAGCVASRSEDCLLGRDKAGDLPGSKGNGKSGRERTAQQLAIAEIKSATPSPFTALTKCALADFRVGVDESLEQARALGLGSSRSCSELNRWRCHPRIDCSMDASFIRRIVVHLCSIMNEDRELGSDSVFVGELDSRRFQLVLRHAQAGRVGKLHRPTVDGGQHGDHVAGCAWHRGNDCPFVAGERIDEAAFADIRRPGRRRLATV